MELGSVKYFKRKGLIVLSVLLCWNIPILAQTHSPQEAVLTSLETNPELQGRWHAFQAAGYDAQGAKGGFLPRVDVTGGTGQQRRDFDDRDTYQTNQVEISLTQMLFDGFRTLSDVRRLEAAQQVRLFELYGTADSVAFEALQAYDDVMRYRKLLDLVRINYDQHLDIEDQIREQVTQGVGRGTDLDQVSGRVALTEANLLAEAANLHDVSARYLRIVGELPSENAENLNIRYKNLPETIQETLYAAYQGNSEFHSVIKNIESSQAAVNQERSNFFPRLELRARSSTQQNIGVFNDLFDGNQFGDDTVVELAFTYNIYRGGANRAAVRRSLSIVDEAKSRRDQACVNLRQTVQIAYSDIGLIEERLISLRQHRDAINRVRVAYAAQFQIGQRTLLDVLDAESEFFQSSRALVEAEHELTMAHAELLSITGRLLPELEIAKSEMMFLGVDGDLASINVEESSACPPIAPKTITRNDLLISTFILEADDLFDSGSTRLKNEARDDLDALIEELSLIGRSIKLTIEGHTDDARIKEISDSLSEGRAAAVRDYLVLSGGSTDFMEVKGYGFTKPIADNETAEGRKTNRRIEIKVNIPSRAKKEEDEPARAVEVISLTSSQTEADSVEVEILSGSLDSQMQVELVEEQPLAEAISEDVGIFDNELVDRSEATQISDVVSISLVDDAPVNEVADEFGGDLELIVSSEGELEELEDELILAELESSNAAVPEEGVSDLLSSQSQDSLLDDLKTVVSSWLMSWQDQDIDAYFAHFSESYVPMNNYSQAQWREDRIKKITAPDSIAISFQDFELVQFDESDTVVSFVMQYSNSNGYADKTHKELCLVQENGVWLINLEANLETNRR